MVRFSHIFIFLLLALGVGVASAQSVECNRQLIMVNGTVVSVTDDEPLVGAMVAVKGTQQAVATDFEGRFSIEAYRGSILVVSYVGYDKAEVTADDTTKIVRLIPSKFESGWIYCEGNREEQPVKVTGRVISATDGSPLSGAPIYYRDGSNGKYVLKVGSDYDGRFELDFVPEDSLMVSYLGCKTQKFLPTGDSILVRMEEENSILFVCPTCVVYPISGVVLDEKGEPIIGATVKIKGCNTIVPTGVNGEFEIQAQKNDVLEITYIGYKTQTKKVSIKKPMKIKMKPIGHHFP